MAQISRPFQVALAVVVLLAAVWLFALQGHTSTSSGGSGSSSSASTTPAPARSSTGASTHGASTRSATSAGATATTHSQHGSAPGVEGLTRAIAKAHEASATAKPASATHSATATHSGASARHSGSSATHSGASARHSGSSATHSAGSGAATPSGERASSSASIPAGQRAVELELEAGYVSVVMFWNPNGAEDVADYGALVQVQRSALASRTRVAVQAAPASAVAEYGSVTRGVQVYATPTILVVAKGGHALVLTGLQDAFAIEQTIEEARQLAAGKP